MPVADRVAASVAAIRGRTPFRPEIGVVLGTGLGGLVRDVSVDAEIPYHEIPGFRSATVQGHAGRLVLGSLAGRRLCIMQGRFHYYEGYEMADVAYPVRVLKALGAGALVVTNASGGVNPRFAPGDICIITDHINLMGSGPLRGEWESGMGPRFPAMNDCYDPTLVVLAEAVATELGLAVKRGVYVGLAGPSLETAAEYRMVRLLGGDLVGMSTVPEVIVARQGGLRVAAFSVVTNVHSEQPESKPRATSLEDVLGVAEGAGEKLAMLVREFVRRI